MKDPMTETLGGWVKRSEVLAQIPTSWLDPLLSGPNRVLPKDGSYSPGEIEKLLLVIRAHVEKIPASPAHPASEAVRRLAYGIKTAREHLVTLGGDPRTVIADHGAFESDMVQAAILDIIDNALAPFLPKENEK